MRRFAALLLSACLVMYTHPSPSFAQDREDHEKLLEDMAKIEYEEINNRIFHLLDALQSFKEGGFEQDEETLGDLCKWRENLEDWVTTASTQYQQEVSNDPVVKAMDRNAQQGLRMAEDRLCECELYVQDDDMPDADQAQMGSSEPSESQDRDLDGIPDDQDHFPDTGDIDGNGNPDGWNDTDPADLDAFDEPTWEGQPGDD